MKTFFHTNRQALRTSSASIHLTGNDLRLGTVTFPPVSREKNCVAIAVEKALCFSGGISILFFFRLSALSRSSRPVLDFFKPSQIKMVWDAAFLTPSCESSSPHLAQKSRNTIAEQTKYSYMIRYMLGKLTTPGWTQPNSSCKLEPQVLKLVLAKYLACTQRSSASSCLLFNRSVFHCWSSSTDPWPQQRGTTF